MKSNSNYNKKKSGTLVNIFLVSMLGLMSQGCVSTAGNGGNLDVSEEISSRNELDDVCSILGEATHDKTTYFLRSAVDAGDAKTVKRLIEVGADVHVGHGELLHVAAYRGYTEIVVALLEAGADVHSQNETALRAAALAGHTETVVTLLEAGADVFGGGPGRNSALDWAEAGGHMETVEVILNAMSKQRATLQPTLTPGS